MRDTTVIAHARLYRPQEAVSEPVQLVIRRKKIIAILPEEARLAESSGSVNARKAFVLPGLIDLRADLGASLLDPHEYSTQSLSFGTTTALYSTADLVHVGGYDAMDAYLRTRTANRSFYTLPADVLPWKWETDNAVWMQKDLQELLHHPRIRALDHVPVRRLLSEGETSLHSVLALARQERGKAFHIMADLQGLSAEELEICHQLGIDTDYGPQTKDGILTRCRMGFFICLSPASLNEEVLSVVEENRLYEQIALVSGPRTADQLADGHLNAVLRQAVHSGMPYRKALYCCTVTPARYLDLPALGETAVGYEADLQFLTNLLDEKPTAVYAQGDFTHNQAEPVYDAPEVNFPLPFYHSVNCREAEPEDFILRTSRPDVQQALVHVLSYDPQRQIFTLIQRNLPVMDGRIQWQASDLCLVLVYERYGLNGNVGCGLLAGAFTGSAALATTYSPQAHPLLVIGKDSENMRKAQKKVLDLSGGIAISEKGRLTASLALPVGGILSSQAADLTARELSRLRICLKRNGWSEARPVIQKLTHAERGGVCLSDQGYVDPDSGEILPLLVSEK